MEKIRSIIILEILGRPAEYVKESLNKILENLKKEQGARIINSKVAEPKKFERSDKGELFSSFAEVELETANISVLANLMFRYMPSHVEIIEPEKLEVKNIELNSILNDLILKLHRYDELAKILSLEKGILARQLMQFKQATKQTENIKIQDEVKQAEASEEKQKKHKPKKQRKTKAD